MAHGNPLKIGNKLKRQSQNLKIKKLKESTKRDARLRRRREEDKQPELRAQRRARNIPVTIDKKRTWDEVDSGDEEDDLLRKSVDILHVKRRKPEDELDDTTEMGGSGFELFDSDDANGQAGVDLEAGEEDGERDSMLDSDSDEDDNADMDADTGAAPTDMLPPPDRAPSEVPSTATDLTVRPEALKARFPALFDRDPSLAPKVLITTSINSMLHPEAELLASLFPHSTYIRRTAHFHGYKYSLREICRYASSPSRGPFTHVAVLNEERKRPSGLDVVVLPAGPTFHFSVSHWVPGAKIPGHGNPTGHVPELILNGFRTALGLLTAHLFRSLFPAPGPELAGRQVVTLHNQRDYIFVRRHRYVFRDRRASEKRVQGADGKPLPGVEAIRAGLQELGPRFTLKLRRVDRGIQRASGQEWEWKAHDEKVRTRFSL